MSPAGWQDRLGALASEPVGPGLVLHVARSFGERRRGLARMAPMPPDRGLHIVRTRSVHTFGMRFALDLVWIGRSGDVVRIDRDVPARRLRLCVGARSVVEVRAGQGDVFAHALD